MSKETGGPAFPLHDSGNGRPFDVGMTLRDYFAAKAMQGYVVDKDAGWCNGQIGLAKYAYDMADAMLEARK